MTSRPGTREAETLSSVRCRSRPAVRHHVTTPLGRLGGLGAPYPQSRRPAPSSTGLWAGAPRPQGTQEPRPARPGWPRLLEPQGECAEWPWPPPPRPGPATAAGASGRVCTEWPWPGCMRSLGCLLQADVLLWPAGPASHPAPRASGQGPHALVLVPVQPPTPDGQAGLGRFAPAFAGAVGLSAHSTQSRVPGEHTSTKTAGGEPRLDCAKAVCDIRRQCHGGLLTVQCPGPGLPGSPGGGGTGWKRRREPGTREAPGTSSWCHT